MVRGGIPGPAWRRPGRRRSTRTRPGRSARRQPARPRSRRVRQVTDSDGTPRRGCPLNQPWVRTGQCPRASPSAHRDDRSAEALWSVSPRGDRRPCPPPERPGRDSPVAAGAFPVSAAPVGRATAPAAATAARAPGSTTVAAAPHAPRRRRTPADPPRGVPRASRTGRGHGPRAPSVQPDAVDGALAVGQGASSATARHRRDGTSAVRTVPAVAVPRRPSITRHVPRVCVPTAPGYPAGRREPRRADGRSRR
jgi:hypothetical protein